jgi:hypothetical protein
VNLNYLVNTNYKQQLNSVLDSYGLHSTVTSQLESNNYTVYPWVNGLSDHDGQIIIIYHDKCNMSQKKIHAQRVINEFSLLDFQINLSYELWDDVFTDNDVDIIFSNLLNTYIRIVNSCFRIIKSQGTYIYIYIYIYINRR